MDKELQQLIKKASENVDKIIEMIRDYERRVRAVLYNIRELQEKLNKEIIPHDIRDYVEEDATNEAPYILNRYAMEAVELHKEFNIESLKDDLTEAIFQKNIYDIYISRYGDYVDVEIDLELSAGTIEDYARAIQAVRENFTLALDPISASIFWAVIYKAGREGKKYIRTYGKGGPGERKVDRTEEYIEIYNRTMSLRKANFVKLAPWWNIVEYGNGLTLSSDRGGIAYPKNTGQGFLQRAIDEIRNYATRRLQREINIYHESIQQDIYNSREQLERYQEIIRALGEVDLTEPEIASGIIQKHLERYYSEERIETITEQDIQDIVDQIVSGESKARFTTSSGNLAPRTISLLREYNDLVQKILGD